MRLVTPALVSTFKTLIENPTAISDCEAAVELLMRCRALEFLRELARPVSIDPSTPNYVAAQSAELNRCIGVNEVLELLLRFRSIAAANQSTEQLSPDFGALDKAIETQDLTKEEADALRNNSPIPKLTRSTNTLTE